MYKIIDLGSEFPTTGESRVSLLDGSLIKTASNEIQDYWDSITDTDRYAYIWVLGVSAGEYYGCNNNGDYFEEDALKKYKDTFLSNAHVFLHHINKDPNKSLGKPVFVYYNDDMHRVELILQLDRKNSMSKDTLRKLKNNEPVFVSMGCNVPYDKCSYCGAHARSRQEYCDHLKYNMKKILPNGQQIFAINPTPKFFDISLVSKPADPTCFALDKVASEDSEGVPFMLSADAGEKAQDYNIKLAAINKLSDILKQVEGEAIDQKTDWPLPFNMDNCPDIDLPVMDFDDLEEAKISPGGVIRISVFEGLPPSFGEAAYASGKHHFGDGLRREDVGNILSLIPAVLSILRMNPDKMVPLAREVFDDYNEGELDSGHAKKIYGPVIKERKNLLEKTGAVMPDRVREKHLDPSDTPHSVARGFSSSQISPYGPAYSDTFTVKSPHGEDFETDRRSIIQAQGAQAVPDGIRKLLGGVMSAASIGALFSEPALAKKLMSSGILGAGAYTLLKDDKSGEDTLQSVEGAEIPATTMFHSKKASQNAAAVGMAVPAALGADYLYNRKIKYPNHPYPEMEMSGMGRKIHEAGEKVKENPLTSLAAGGIAGGATAEGLKKLLLKR